MMRAMVLPAGGASLLLQEREDPAPGDGQIRVRVSACGVCRTDLHVVDGNSRTSNILLSQGTRSWAASISWAPA